MIRSPFSFMTSVEKPVHNRITQLTLALVALMINAVQQLPAILANRWLRVVVHNKCVRHFHTTGATALDRNHFSSGSAASGLWAVVGNFVRASFVKVSAASCRKRCTRRGRNCCWCPHLYSISQKEMPKGYKKPSIRLRAKVQYTWMVLRFDSDFALVSCIKKNKRDSRKKSIGDRFLDGSVVKERAWVSSGYNVVGSNWIHHTGFRTRYMLRKNSFTSTCW